MKNRKFDIFGTPEIYHINHVYESALYAAKATDLSAGIHILETGLSNWPDIRDREIEKLKREMS